MSAHPGGLTREHVIWAYRLLLDREPEDESVIGPKLAGSANTQELRNHLIASGEFAEKNPDVARTQRSTVVIVELEHGAGTVRLFVDLADHVIGLGILRGEYERDEIALVQRLLKPGDTALDLGGHIGFFSMHMAATVGPTGRVYAFEPLDSNASLFERSIAENGFGERLILARAAAGRSPGDAVLTVPKETLNTGGAYVLADNQEPPAGHLRVRVPRVALDALPLRRPVHLIKMDIEGAEPQAIDGALVLLREDRPMVLSEVHPVQLERASGSSVPAFLAQMIGAGYEALHVDGTPFRPDGHDTPATAWFRPRP